MKRVFLVMVVSALLVTFGFAQTPDAGSNTDPANVKGCLGGSDGNYTVVEDGTGQIFKITTSSVDLKPHLGHDVKLIGHKAGAAASPGAADNSFAVTELSMISEHCAAAAAAAAAQSLSACGDCHRTRYCSRCACNGCQRTSRGPSCRCNDCQRTCRGPCCTRRDCQRARGGTAAPAATVTPSAAAGQHAGRGTCCASACHRPAPARQRRPHLSPVTHLRLPWKPRRRL